jgi:streptogrisin C
MDRHIARRLAAVALTAGVVATLAAASGASAAPRPDAADAVPMTVDAASPEMMAALQRDFNLTAEQARNRLAREDIASRTADKLGSQLGSAFGGAWINDDQALVVAVTDARHANQVRALGAEAAVVARSEAALNRAKAQLDRAGAPDPAQVTGWYVDVQNNTVVVQAKPGARAAANAFIQASGIDADAVRIQTTSETPRTLYDVRGGDAYYPGSSRCSIGFSVNGGFVTAGHCGGTGTSVRGYNQVTMGSVQGSNFPGRDYAWVAVNSSWTPTPLVNRYSGSQTVTVAGSQEAAVGASVCRSGSTTGWRCGTIQAKNQTVNYPQGSVQGLTRTTACAEGGDSGGSWLAGQQAQGVTSGGSGNCSVGGTTYFQPIWPILSAYGRTLVTSGGGGGTPPPPTGCSSYPNVYNGSLSGTGSYQYEPNGSYFYWNRSGTHQGCLSGPSNADFDLYLQRWNGSSWATVASSTGSTSQESLSYNGSAGYYRYVVYSYSGSGSYTLGISVP